MKVNFLLAAMLCLSTFCTVASAKEEMELVPSVWAAWMRGSVNVNGQNAKVVRAADDYFDNLNYGYSLELALRNDQMVILGFVDYFDPLSSDVTVDGQPGTLESSEIIGCIAVGYPLASGKSTVDFLIGLQTVQLDNKLEVNGVPTKDSTDVYDAVLMLRIKQELFSNFYINIPLSIGGSYMGDSEFVYDAAIQLLYQFGDSFDVRAGYRISGYDFSEDADATDFYQQGYTLGIGLTF